MLNIKVLGIGGTEYSNLVKNLNRAIEQLDLNVHIEYLREVEDFIKYEILEIPALVVNETVILKGESWKKKEILSTLKNIYKSELKETEEV